MTTNKPGYMSRYKMELRTEVAFLATEGSMVSEVSGIPLKICNDRKKSDECATYHHELRLNGNRPNGTVARLLEMKENYWNIEMLTIGEHRTLHQLDGAYNNYFKTN